ncbi:MULTISPECIES: radical SAM (seleno)protein TrsS [Anoxynatronum]|uniref:Radical SAM core domain-containing protein n=2 Tax=Anoxynatronum TaxID=210622 RepID=A0AA46AHL1_9CLOT|nr:radical SAM (seleno)protein TrsS [Anoxynatronum buryatiense]SMP40005.1 hypothetical protein SAMN06296020_101311 [Anoxynatronum buryatiense]
MKFIEEHQVSMTESLCPVCLRKLEAHIVRNDHLVSMVKTCTEHGDFRTILWRGKPDYEQWQQETVNDPPLYAPKVHGKGCPYDCGICGKHQQQACCVLVEVTSRCDQQCTVCYADVAKAQSTDPSIERIGAIFRHLVHISEDRPFNIQLSGGEPTLRDDLPQIVKSGKQEGLPYIQLNTNGQRLAEDEAYVEALKEAGLSAVFLQFDGVSDDVYENLRGHMRLDMKKKAIENCRKYELGTVLVPTLVPGINTHQIGEIIEFALQYLPTVRGVHFQPVSYFGKYPHMPSDTQRITLPEVIRQIEIQTDGKIQMKDLKPLKTGCSLCSFKGSFVVDEGGAVRSLSSQGGCGCQQEKQTSEIVNARDFVKKKWEMASSHMEKEGQNPKSDLYDFTEWDAYLNRIRNAGFSITCMAFQDVWNLDLSRLKKCSVAIFDADSNELIPFCAYNITSSSGNALHRRSSH